MSCTNYTGTVINEAENVMKEFKTGVFVTTVIQSSAHDCNDPTSCSEENASELVEENDSSVLHT